MFYLCSITRAATEVRSGLLRLDIIEMPLGRAGTHGSPAKRARLATGLTPRRDITCGGNVMAKLAKFRQCDGVMDQITCFSITRENGA
jgi:hypothetical protein